MSIVILHPLLSRTVVLSSSTPIASATAQDTCEPAGESTLPGTPISELAPSERVRVLAAVRESGGSLDE